MQLATGAAAAVGDVEGVLAAKVLLWIFQEAPPPKKARQQATQFLADALASCGEAKGRGEGKGQGKGELALPVPLPLLCASMTTLLAADPDDKAAPRAVVQLLTSLLPLHPQSLHLLSALKAALLMVPSQEHSYGDAAAGGAGAGSGAGAGKGKGRARARARARSWC